MHNGDPSCWFIVGGSSGIGFALAQLLHWTGHPVAIFSRNEKKIDEARTAICERSPLSMKHPSMKVPPPQLFGTQLDVCDAAAGKQAFSAAAEALGSPHVIVNSAGTVYPQYFQQLTDQQFDSMVQTNIYGMWNIARIAIPYLDQTKGTFVQIASMAALLGTFGYTGYAATKFANLGFAEALRNEMKPRGITISIVCPPDTDTPQLHEENKIKPPETAAISHSVRPLPPIKVARAILKGVRTHKFMIIPGASARLIGFLKRLFPSLIYREIDSIVRKQNKKTK